MCAGPGPASAFLTREPSARLPKNATLCYDYTYNDRGEVAERLKALASKASVRETVPWVRIPPSPPVFRLIFRVRMRERGVQFPPLPLFTEGVGRN